MNKTILRLVTAVFLAALSSSAAAKGDYLYDVLKKKPAYRAAWNTLIKGQKVDPWLAHFSKTFDGPCDVVGTATIDGVSYMTGWVCKAHDCGGNTFNVIFAPKGKQAWGLWKKDGSPPKYLGKPSTAQKAVLEKLFEPVTAKEPLVFLNGSLVPASQANLSIFDAGLVLGAAVTEMTRTFRHRLWKLDAHLDRLDRALAIMRLDLGTSRAELTAASNELAAHNAALLPHPDDELGLIHFVTPGDHEMYAGEAATRIGPTVCIHTFPLPWNMWAGKMETGAHVVTPSVRHVPSECWDATIKCRSRMNYYLAGHEVRQIDPEALALLLDLNGNVTETHGANIALVEDGTIVFPTTRNTLPGVSRAMVFELAATLGIAAIECDFPLSRLEGADEAFLSSTPYCLMPVTRVNGTIIRDGAPGPVYQRLLSAWSERIGMDIARQIREGALRR